MMTGRRGLNAATGPGRLPDMRVNPAACPTRDHEGTTEPQVCMR